MDNRIPNPVNDDLPADEHGAHLIHGYTTV